MRLPRFARAIVFGVATGTLTFLLYMVVFLAEKHTEIPGGPNRHEYWSFFEGLANLYPGFLLRGSAFFVGSGFLVLLLDTRPRILRVAAAGISCAASAALTGLLEQNRGTAFLEALQADPVFGAHVAIKWGILGMISGLAVSWVLRIGRVDSPASSQR